MMLMCKNTSVYDIEKEKTLNYNLLPGLMQQKGADNHTFTKWMKYRYSSGTNTIARKLKGITFGQGARMRINRETRALSFNDCYWTKAEDDSICFEEISPYYKPFWDGNEEFTGQAAPTLYVGGALSKEWKQDGKLYKYGDISVELQCIKLCRECGISVERADETDGGIAISNITSPKVMLEQADQSGRIDPDDFDEQTIIDLFGKAGAQMLIIDAIIGNGDFDHALDSTLESDRLLTDAVKFCMPYEDEMVRIAGIAQGSENEVFKKRAQSILKLIDAGK